MELTKKISVFLVIAIHALLSQANLPNPDDPTDYGVDVTFPIHHYITERDSFFAKRYGDYITGCYRKWGSKIECDTCERARLEMSVLQPASEHNYTEVGFKKTRVPEDLWKEISRFFEENQDKQVMELWPKGNTYVNYWESPTYMVSFEDTNLRGGLDLKQRIWDELRPVIEEWVGRPVHETSLYGIRIYKRGAILAPHVDRLPLISSAIINVAQKVEEPWYAELYSHDGKAYNVTMEPGDMVLYESHTTLHGRPFPMKGDYFANIFVHFKPFDHDDNNERDRKAQMQKEHEERQNNRWNFRNAFNDAMRKLSPSSSSSSPSKSSKPQKSRTPKTIAGHEQSNHNEEEMRKHKDSLEDVEEFAEKDLLEGVHYSKVPPKVSPKEGLRTPGQTALHIAAGKGDLDTVQKLLSKGSSDLNAKDLNDWQAVHESALRGHVDVLKYLIKMGAEVAVKTKQGGTPLWWARRTLPENHEVIHYLESIGAPDESDEF